MLAGREAALAVCIVCVVYLAWLTSDGMRDWLVTGLGGCLVVSVFAHLIRGLSRYTRRATMGVGPGPSRADRRSQ